MDENSKYRKAFQSALARTENEGHTSPILLNNFGNHAPYFSQNNYEALYQIFSRYFAESDGTFDLSKIKGTCLQNHSKIQAILKKEIGLKSELTIGYVSMFGREFYKFDRIADIKARHTHNPAVKMIDIHVWLTLPSMEILDFTFLAHFHFVNATPEKKILLLKAPNFDFLFGSSDSLYNAETTIHTPLYVGENVLQNCGFIS